MAVKDLRNRTQFSSTLKNEIFKKLRDYSNETGVPMTRVLDSAVSSYLEGWEKRKDK